MRLATSATTTTPPALRTIGLENRTLIESGVRDRAEAVLQSLVAAKAECEKTLTKLRRTDAMKSVTGKSSFERAINSTKQLIRELEDSAPAPAATNPGCEVEVRASSWCREPLAAVAAGVGHGV